MGNKWICFNLSYEFKKRILNIKLYLILTKIYIRESCKNIDDLLSALNYNMFNEIHKYFINIDYENKYPEMQPENFCLELIKNANVTGIPISVFYDKNTDKKAVSNLIRLCFAKNDEILIKAANQIGQYLS